MDLAAILNNIRNAFAGHGYADGSTWERPPEPARNGIETELGPLGGLTHPAAYEMRMRPASLAALAPRPAKPSHNVLPPLAALGGATMPGAYPTLNAGGFSPLPTTQIAGGDPVRAANRFEPPAAGPVNIGGARDVEAARRSIAAEFYSRRWGPHSSKFETVPWQEAYRQAGGSEEQIRELALLWQI